MKTSLAIAILVFGAGAACAPSSDGGPPAVTGTGGGDQAPGSGGQRAGTGGAAGGGAGTGGSTVTGSGGAAPGSGGGAMSTGGAGGAAAGSGGARAPGSGGRAAGTGGAVVVGSGGATAGSGGARAPGSGGGAPDAGMPAGSGGAPVTPPMPDRGSTLPIASPGGGYRVEGNIPYGPLTAQRLDVMYPTAAGPNGTQRLPGVIMFHGGGWIEGDKATMSSFYSRFLSHGFLVATVEYRLADGTAMGAIAPAAIEDALLAAKWFWDHLDYYHVDRTKYVVTGASAGGMLALMVGMATPAAALGPTSPTDYQIAAIVNGYGPTDVPDLLRRGTSWAVQWLPANTPGRDALATRVSPITYVRADIPPLITVQGANDTTVPVAQNQHLDDLLKAAGADAQIHLVPGAGHGFSTPATAYPDAEKAMFDFLVAHGIGR